MSYLPTPPPTPLMPPSPLPPRKTSPSLLPAFPDASALPPALLGVEDWTPTGMIQPIPLGTPRYRTNSTPVTYGSAFSTSPISSSNWVSCTSISTLLSEVSDRLRSKQQSQMIAQLSSLNLEVQDQDVAQSQSPQMAQASPPHHHRLLGKDFERELRKP